MATIKFNGHDRLLVIAQIEKEFAIKLEPIGRRQKYLRDNTGRRYCIFGGYGDWHGLPEEVVEMEQKNPSDSVLVVAKRRDTAIDIYAGPLRLLIEGKQHLAYTKDGQYEFNLDISGNRLSVRELPNIVLWRLGTSEAEKAASKPLPQLKADRDLAKLKAAISMLPHTERAELIETLRKQGL